MERYKEYKDSQIQWIGEIPSHWEARKMKYCFQERSEKNHPDEPILCATQSQGVIPQSMYANRVVVVNKGFEGLKFVKEGDFVISLRSFEGGIEYAHYQGIISAAYTILKPNKKAESDYLRYLLKSYSFIQLLRTCVTGIREGQNINYPLLSRKYIPLPPLSEQERIVSFLEEKTAKIDTYVREKEKELQLLNELKESEIANVITHGLNPNVKMKDSGIPWIGMIPEHWEMNILKRYINKRKTGCWGSEPKALEIDCFCLRIADFEYDNYRFQSKDNFTIRSYKEKDLEERILKQGDILIEKSGGGEKSPVGRAVLYDLPIENAMYANFMEKISPKDELSSNYLLYLLATMYSKRAIWRYIKFTTGIQNLDITALLSNEKIPIPPIDEQRSIVAYIEQKCSKINSLISELEAEIEHLKEYKQRLIADCVTGQINVQNL